MNIRQINLVSITNRLVYNSYDNYIIHISIQLNHRGTLQKRIFESVPNLCLHFSKVFDLSQLRKWNLIISINMIYVIWDSDSYENQLNIETLLTHRAITSSRVSCSPLKHQTLRVPYDINQVKHQKHISSHGIYLAYFSS